MSDNLPTGFHNYENISNVMKWVIIFAPFIALMLFSGGNSSSLGIIEFLIFGYIASVVACYVDAENLKNFGIKSDKKTLFIPPVYLKNRAKTLNQKKSHFDQWFSVLIGGILMILLINYANDDKRVCDTVTNILAQNFNNAASCKSVNLTGKRNDNYRNGIVTLDNGNQVNISVTKLNDGETRVEINDDFFNPQPQQPQYSNETFKPKGKIVSGQELWGK